MPAGINLLIFAVLVILFIITPASILITMYLKKDKGAGKSENPLQPQLAFSPVPDEKRIRASSSTVTAPQTGYQTPCSGEKIGNYIVIKEINSGGMGKIIQGVSEEGTFAAIKIMKPEHTENEMLVGRFQQELRIVSRLSHDNIAKLIEWGMENGRHYFAMEYVDGISLRELLEDENPEIPRIISIMKQTCSAIGYAHSQKVIHRDVKPENILVDKSSKVKVVDFGIARLNEGGTRSLTLTNISMGSPLYMSPEQKKDFKHVDERTDIYSLGVVFYEMLSGELPGGLLRIDLVPEGLRTIIQKAIAYDPDERYQGVGELLSELEKYEQAGNIVDDQELLQEIGENAKLREVMIDALYPKSQFQFEGLDISHFYLPAVGIGGNYFDFLKIDARHLGILVGNVFEKTDARSAIFLAMLRSAFRICAEGEPNPANALKKLNNFISRERFDRFAVFSYLVINTGTKILSVSTAGYRPVQILKDKAAAFEHVKTEGIGLGIMEGSEFGLACMPLSPNDIIVMSSGGIPETRNLKNEIFGQDRFENSIIASRQKDSIEIAEKLRRELVSFSRGTAQQDDITFLTVKIK